MRGDNSQIFSSFYPFCIFFQNRFLCERLSSLSTIRFIDLDQQYFDKFGSFPPIESTLNSFDLTNEILYNNEEPKFYDMYDDNLINWKKNEQQQNQQDSSSKDISLIFWYSFRLIFLIFFIL